MLYDVKFIFRVNISLSKFEKDFRPTLLTNSSIRSRCLETHPAALTSMTLTKTQLPDIMSPRMLSECGCGGKQELAFWGIYTVLYISKMPYGTTHKIWINPNFVR
jgi:hypothetical protein